ncbi:hypothetical protein N9N99_02375 [Gammaproteobacteria bacterium]|nr:hypothetical protein [Gammaproteobacteria bacterium]
MLIDTIQKILDSIGNLLGFEWNPYSAHFFLILISLYLFASAVEWWKGKK